MNAGTVITLHSLHSIHRVKAEDILLIHCDSSICDVVLLSGQVILVSKPLNYFESILSVSWLVRINRSDLVNFNHIVEIRKEGTRKKTCVLSNGKCLPISYRKWSALKELINN